jgi:hypothetical protein
MMVYCIRVFEGSPLGTGIMLNNKVETNYDGFLSLGSWYQAVFVGAPAAVILAGMYFFDVGSEWWTPVLVIYGFSAVGYCLSYGFMAVNLQITETARWTVETGSGTKTNDLHKDTAK